MDPSLTGAAVLVLVGALVGYRLLRRTGRTILKLLVAGAALAALLFLLR